MLGDLKSTLGSMNHDGLGGSWARISGFMEHRRGEIPDVQPVLAPSMNKLPIFDKFFFGGGCSIILKVRLWGALGRRTGFCKSFQPGGLDHEG